MVTLVILDGFGHSDNDYGNAIKKQGTPYLNKLTSLYPHTLLDASGEAVGLTDGQMGNSEVGHLNIGAGRVVYQDLSRINNLIKNNQLQNNQNLIDCFNHTKKYNSSLHIMGLVSNGGVHSHISHLIEIIKLAKENNVKSVYIHCFLDGRDTPIKSGKDFVRELSQNLYGAKIKSLIGRLYAMDRENRYDRTEVAYNMLTLGKADSYYDNIDDAFEDSYNDGVTDEFFKPTIIGRPALINSNDSVIFFNFRTDRARQITASLTDSNFDKFETKKITNLFFLSMSEYDESFKNVKTILPPLAVEDNLSSVLAENNKKQFRVTETTKYAHITHFFNGTIEKPYKNEERKLIESIDEKDFSVVPDMRAFEICEEAVQKIASNNYDFILVNLSNPDMIGHTGNFDATVRAIQTVDKCAYMIALATLMAGGEAIITADHGNAEKMLLENGEVCTTHTNNKVPFILVSEKNRKKKLINNGKLANIAPTILELLNIEKPISFEKSLIK